MDSDYDYKDDLCRWKKVLCVAREEGLFVVLKTYGSFGFPSEANVIFQGIKIQLSSLVTQIIC